MADGRRDNTGAGHNGGMDITGMIRQNEDGRHGMRRGQYEMVRRNIGREACVREDRANGRWGSIVGE